MCRLSRALWMFAMLHVDSHHIHKPACSQIIAFSLVWMLQMQVILVFN